MQILFENKLIEKLLYKHFKNRLNNSVYIHISRRDTNIIALHNSKNVQKNRSKLKLSFKNSCKFSNSYIRYHDIEIGDFVLNGSEKEFIECLERWKSAKFYQENLDKHAEICMLFHVLTHELGHTLQLDNNLFGKRKIVNDLSRIRKEDFYFKDLKQKIELDAEITARKFGPLLVKKYIQIEKR